MLELFLDPHCVSAPSAIAVAKEIYEEIKKTFGIPFVPHLFKAMGHNAGILEAKWRQIFQVMTKGTLDSKTKEIIAVAVSATNNCRYRIDLHTANLERMGVNDAQLHGDAF